MSRAEARDALRASAAAHAISWPRAAAVTVGTFMLIILAFFYVPHWLLTQLDTPSRAGRVWLATAWMALTFALACAAALRTTRPVTRSE